MNNNKKYVKDVYDEIHAPDALFGKVMDMKNDIKKTSILRYVAGVAATLGVAFVASNGICYAATGETWVEKVKVYIDGEESEEEMTYHKEGDMVVGEMEIELEDGSTAYIESETPDDGNTPETTISVDNGTVNYDIEGCAPTGRLIEEDGKTILLIGNQEIDITKDYEDGEATGVVTIDGVGYTYTISGGEEGYSVSVEINE